MLSKSTMMVAILAILAGLGAAFGVRSYMAQEKEVPVKEEKAAPAKIVVPVAGVDLPADRLVSEYDIVRLHLTKEEFDAKFKGIEPEQIIVSNKGIIGRRLREPMKRLQPFLTTKFYLEGSGPAITKKLQPGYRAVRVEVPESRQAGVLIGMMVDVLFRADAQSAKKGQVAIPEKTITMLQHVEVIDIQRPAGTKATTKKQPLLFTLAVPENKVDMFGVIEGRGELWLVPATAKGDDKDKKNPEGAGAAVANASTLADLLGIKPVEKNHAPPPFETAVYRRGRMEINHFVDGKFVANYRVNRPLSGSEDAGVSSQAVPPKPENPAPAAPPAPEQQ